MTKPPFCTQHWIEIEQERYDRYQRMFQWNPSSSVLYESADIQPGHVVADFGCGPDYTALGIAEWVGPKGHVHALDIDETFVADAVENGRKAGLSDKITVHWSDGSRLPLSDGCLDRITTRNTLIYVDDPLVTLEQFKRASRKDGKMHAIEGDWPMMVVEPVEKWETVVSAAAYACRTTDIGRKLTGLLKKSGFRDIHIDVIARSDMEGRLLPMIKTIAEYARAGGQMHDNEIDGILRELDQALADNTYLALAPQFVVTGCR